MSPIYDICLHYIWAAFTTFLLFFENIVFKTDIAYLLLKITGGKGWRLVTQQNGIPRVDTQQSGTPCIPKSPFCPPPDKEIAGPAKRNYKIVLVKTI